MRAAIDRDPQQHGTVELAELSDAEAEAAPTPAGSGVQWISASTSRGKFEVTLTKSSGRVTVRLGDSKRA